MWQLPPTAPKRDEIGRLYPERLGKGQIHERHVGRVAKGPRHHDRARPARSSQVSYVEWRGVSLLRTADGNPDAVDVLMQASS